MWVRLPPRAPRPTCWNRETGAVGPHAPPARVGSTPSVGTTTGPRDGPPGGPCSKGATDLCKVRAVGSIPTVSTADPAANPGFADEVHLAAHRLAMPEERVRDPPSARRRSMPAWRNQVDAPGSGPGALRGVPVRVRGRVPTVRSAVGSAPGLGPGGRRFEPCRTDHRPGARSGVGTSLITRRSEVQILPGRPTECGAVGSARSSGLRGRRFEPGHSDASIHPACGAAAARRSYKPWSEGSSPSRPTTRTTPGLYLSRKRARLKPETSLVRTQPVPPRAARRYSLVAQWQRRRLLTARLEVRVLPGEPVASATSMLSSATGSTPESGSGSRGSNPRGAATRRRSATALHDAEWGSGVPAGLITREIAGSSPASATRPPSGPRTAGSIGRAGGS